MAGGAFATMQSGTSRPRRGPGRSRMAASISLRAPRRSIGSMPWRVSPIGGSRRAGLQHRQPGAAEPRGGAPARRETPPGLRLRDRHDLTVYALVALSDGRLLAGRCVHQRADGRPRGASAGDRGARSDVCRAGRAPDDTVYALAVDGEGRVLVGGRFRRVAGRVRPAWPDSTPRAAPDARFLDGARRRTARRARWRWMRRGGSWWAGSPRAFRTGRGRLVRLTSDGLGISARSARDEAVLAIQPGGDGRTWVGGGSGRWPVWCGRRRPIAGERGRWDPWSFHLGQRSGCGVGVGVAGRRERRVWIGGGFREVNGMARAGVAASVGNRRRRGSTGRAAEVDGLGLARRGGAGAVVSARAVGRPRGVAGGRSGERRGGAGVGAGAVREEPAGGRRDWAADPGIGRREDPARGRRG